MHRRWLLNRTNPEFISYLSRAASVSPVAAQILVNRGIKTAADIQDFLSPSLTGLSDPFDIPGMIGAVARIRTALRNGERVLVHGDYDADGVTATAIMLSALRKMGTDALYFIPNRMVHGYGFNIAGVEAAQKAGAKLIITVDCGIASFDAASYAAGLGIDLIITDHHEPSIKRGARGKGQGTDDINGFEVPHALAVINPKLNTECPALAILSGAGIAFKLAQALSMDDETGFSEEDLFGLLDLAAIGTVADVVPLKGENRIILKQALPYLQDGGRTGVNAIRQAAGLDKRQIKTGHIAFGIVPRINAAGRMGDASDVVRLLLSESAGESSDLAAWLDRNNSERQKVEESVYEEALSLLGSIKPEGAIVLAGEKWHPGVLGIVASKLAESFNMPAFIFTIEDGIAKGSCRSIPAFDLGKGLSECADLLITFGGHKQAAGLKLRADNIAALSDRLRTVILRDIPSEGFRRTLEIDAPAGLNEVNAALMKELELLEPFGFGNPEPLLAARDLEMLYPKVIKDRHLKAKLKKGAHYLDAIGWDMAHLIDELTDSFSFDAVYTPSYNDWNGSRSIQLVLKGIRPSQ